MTLWAYVDFNLWAYVRFQSWNRQKKIWWYSQNLKKICPLNQNFIRKFFIFKDLKIYLWTFFVPLFHIWRVHIIYGIFTWLTSTLISQPYLKKKIIVAYLLLRSVAYKFDRFGIWLLFTVFKINTDAYKHNSAYQSWKAITIKKILAPQKSEDLLKNKLKLKIWLLHCILPVRSLFKKIKTRFFNYILIVSFLKLSWNLVKSL